MKNTAFYILAVLVIVLCVVGACITAAPTEESGADASTGRTSPSGGQSGSGESSENGTSSAEVSREPYIPPDPSVYPTITDADIGPDEIDSFFDDSVFVGHSVMMHFKDKYVAYKRGSDSGFLGGAKFHASASFSCYNNMQPISDSSTHPLYQGEKMKIEDAVAAMGAKTVYFSGMALNEIGIFGAEASAENLASVVDAIKAKSPDVKIVILANTYMVKNFNTYQKLHNGSISEYNNLLLDYCNENGYDFVDISTPLVGGGCLADKYCTDNAEGGSGCHLTADAYAIWTAVLRDYAKAERAGTYVNPDSMPLYSRG